MGTSPKGRRIFLGHHIMLLLTVSLLAGLLSCGQQSPKGKVQPAMAAADTMRWHQGIGYIDSIAPLIQPGDLIFRTGNDFTSQSLRQINLRNKTYSHCGIANIENGQCVVYHALGGEFNPDQKIRRDSLRIFAHPADNRGLGVYRYRVPTSIRQGLLTAAQQIYRAGVMFDMQFDATTHDRMYCAEYVFDCLLLGSKGQIRCSTSRIGHFEFVGVDDLFLHPQCVKVTEIVYK